MLGPLGRRGDEYLRAGDELVSAGVMLAEPHLVVAEPVQRHRPFEVVFQCDGRGLADRVKRRYENPEVASGLLTLPPIRPRTPELQR